MKMMKVINKQTNKQKPTHMLNIKRIFSFIIISNMIAHVSTAGQNGDVFSKWQNAQ